MYQEPAAAPTVAATAEVGRGAGLQMRSFLSQANKYSRQNHWDLLMSSHGHRNEATQHLAKLYPPVQFIPIIFALVLVAAS